MFTFVQDMEGIEFPEALRILAQKAGVEIDRFDPQIKNEKNRLFGVTEASTRFFEKQLHSSSYGKKALEYLIARGLTLDTIKEFRLGYAPNDWYSLSKFLLDYGFSKKEVVDAGLAFQKEGHAGRQAGRTDIYDRFRSRIIFPILDPNGEVVGFTGRIFGLPAQEGEAASDVTLAKYINTPQTQIYDKSRVLYGLNKAKTEIKHNNRCVLVEGNMDMLMSYQAGVKNVIASSGTALTPSHLKLLQRYTNNLSFCFDTDQAGAVATKRGIGLALKQNFNINVISINDKECKDPADYVKKHQEKWAQIVTESKPVVEYYFDKARREYDLNSPEGKKYVIMALAPFVKRLVSQVEQSHWVAQLAFLLRVGDEAVRADIASVKDELDAYDRGEVEADVKTTLVSKNDPQITGAANGEPQPDMYNETLLSVILKNPSLFKGDLNDLPNQVHPFVREIASKIAAYADFNFDNLIKSLEEGKATQLEFAYLRSQELWKDFKDEELKEEFKNLINKIKRRAISSQLIGMEFDIKEAEASKDKTKISSLISRFTKLTDELSQLQEV